MGTEKVETRTASIHFNAKQLHRQMTKTQDTRFCKWFQHLSAAFLFAAEEADDDIADDFIEDEINNADSDVDEFNHLNLTGGVDTIADDDIFVASAEGEGGAEIDQVHGIGRLRYWQSPFKIPSILHILSHIKMHYMTCITLLLF
jgi:hypothetical protein